MVRMRSMPTMKIIIEDTIMTGTLRHPALAPAHPGALIAEVLETSGLSKAEAARQLGVTRAALYNVLDERSAVSADMAVRFEAVTGTSADLLVRMQAGFDLWRARQSFAAAPVQQI
jgi:antitoxin HigA-1